MSLAVRHAGSALTLLFSTVLLSGVVLSSGDAAHAQDSRPAEPIPVELNLTLVDISERLAEGPGGGAEGGPPLLAGAEVELRSRTPEGEVDVARGTADANAVARFSFDARVPGSPYSVIARTADGRSFASKQQSMASIDDRLSLFPLNDDPAGVEQRMMVTVVPIAGEDGTVDRVRVQQLLSIQAQFLHAYRAVPEIAGGGVVFPVPSGAMMRSLNFREEPVEDLTVHDLGDRGRGVVIPDTIFPNDRALFEGEYELEVTEGEVFTLDIECWFDQIALFLFVEEGQFYLAWDEGTDGMPSGLQPMAEQVLQGQAKPFLHYQDATRIEAGRMMRIPVRFDPGGVPAAPPAIPMRLELQLIDISGLIDASPQHGQQMPDPSEHVLRHATAELTSYNVDAEEETITATADRNGVVVFDLGPRNPGSPFTVTARSFDGGADGEGQVFISKEESLSSRTGRFNMYRTTDDHAKLVQQMMMKIVTVLPGQDEDADEVMVQVRQIAPIEYGGTAAYTGPPGAGGAGMFFPVPEGATVTSLTFLEEDILDLTPREVAHWGYGVPIPHPVFPLARGSMIGTYTFTVEKGETFDLGFSAVVETRGFTVAYEEGSFSLDESLLAEWGSPSLSPPRGQDMQDVGRRVVMHSTSFSPQMPVPAHETLRVPVRFGPPPVSARTIWMTLLIVAAFAVPVLGGLWISSRRSSDAGLRGREEQLQALHAQGELTARDLHEELAKVAAARAKLRGESSPPSVPGGPTRRCLSAEEQDQVQALESRLADLPDDVAGSARAVLDIVRRHAEVPSGSHEAQGEDARG